MKTRIVSKEAFKVAGIKGEGIQSHECPSIWDKLYEQGSFIELELLGNGQSMGLCYGGMIDDRINYMAAYNISDENLAKAEAMELDLLDVPAAEYFVATLNGSVPQSIQNGWRYVMEEYFPVYGYEHTGSPDFELYSQGDMTSEDYVMELWVPFTKSSQSII